MVSQSTRKVKGFEKNIFPEDENRERSEPIAAPKAQGKRKDMAREKGGRSAADQMESESVVTQAKPIFCSASNFAGAKAKVGCALGSKV